MSVSHLTQLGIVNGITETTFSPNKEVTRAEFAKMLSLMAGANLSASHGVTPFSDVETNAWYAPAANGPVIGESLWGGVKTNSAPRTALQGKKRR